MLGDELLFPKEFMDIELIGKTFLYVFKNRPEFVDFTKTEMLEPTGFWKIWHDYVTEKHK